jgi:uncharacterized membrane protein HdeD (DUF308 family)
MADRTTGQDLSRLVSEFWWIGVIQAILAILFGVVATFWPHLTLVTLVYLLAAFVIAIGLTEIARGLMSVRARDTWWMTLIIGLLTLGVGIYLARHPSVSFGTFILVVGISFIAWGVIELIRSFLEPITTSSKILNYIAGLSGIAAGIIILLQPVAGGVAFVWVLGLYAFVYGIVALATSVEHHRAYEELRAGLR